MNNEITLKLTRSDVGKLLLLASAKRYDFEREAAKTKDEDLIYDKKRAAEMWKRIADEIRTQRDSQRSEN